MKYQQLSSVAESAVSHNAEIKKRVLLSYNEVPNVTQYARAVFPPRAVAEEHAHSDMYEVFLCESGTGEIVVDGKSYPLSAGVNVVVAPGERHLVRNTDEKAEMVLTYFGILQPSKAE